MVAVLLRTAHRDDHDIFGGLPLFIQLPPTAILQPNTHTFGSLLFQNKITYYILLWPSIVHKHLCAAPTRTASFSRLLFF